MNKDEMIAELKKHDDFKATTPLLVELIQSLSPTRTWKAFFLPKFHCEVQFFWL
jgi:hypothetical protein